jgi:uncharacterized protein YdaU (DUF1376 family)
MLPLFVRDYVTATRHLTLAERGAYTDLLFFQWELGVLPREPERLARLIGCSADEFAEVWTAIQGKFTKTDFGLLNTRLEQHRVKAEQLSAKRADIGRKGGQRSAQAKAQPIAAPIAQPTVEAIAQGNANSPSPTPSPSPTSGVLSENSCPQERTERVRPAYMAQQFHRQIIDNYHEVLPMLPPVKDWGHDRQSLLNARIAERLKAGKAADGLSYWRSFFETVATLGWLVESRPDRSWRCNLEWLLKKANFRKVMEGHYANTQSMNGARTHG